MNDGFKIPLHSRSFFFLYLNICLVVIPIQFIDDSDDDVF